MKLRPRQKTFVQRTTEALSQRGNTLGIAPTGAGKTVMMAALLGKSPKSVIIQHTDELVRQNKKTFEIMNPKMKTSVVNAQVKDFTGDAIFATWQTLVGHLDRLPEIDMLAIDEAHRAPAPSYRKIIDRTLDVSPDRKLLGLTATPMRGDKHGLRVVFDNVADQITLTELIQSGHLVKPRTFVMDIGISSQILNVRKTSSGEFDQEAVAAIIDKRVHNERIVEEWEAKAANRQTAVFCPTVDHAEHMAEMWREKGYKCEAVHGNLEKFKRKKILEAYDRGEIQILTTVFVLTEGWDHQPTSCIVLTRPCSFKGAMIQMIGRGLRKVDPARYPGVRKDDCIVMDFGASLLAHGDLESHATIEKESVIDCPECHAKVPDGIRECPLCGYEFFEKIEIDPETGRAIPQEREEVTSFVMREVDILEASPFKWVPIQDTLTVCTAISAEAFLGWWNDRWYAFGIETNDRSQVEEFHFLGDSDEYVVVLASADDFMRKYGDTDKGNKAKRWMGQQPTAKQADFLQKRGMGMGDMLAMDRYTASCHISFNMRKSVLKRGMEVYAYDRAA